MKTAQLENLFLKKEISKSEYISRMYVENHDILFQYSEFIKNRDIKKIEIIDDCVIMTSRELGIKMICNRFDERIAPIEILNFKKYEEKDANMIFKLIQDADTVFDIGGNIGWYSLGLDKAKEKLDIYTFEPIPQTYQSLIVNIELNKAKINAFNFGLSDKKQEVRFYFHKEGSGNASSALMNEERENIEVKCRVDTLDNFFTERSLRKLDFIKCDVEGAELLTFKGGEKTIAKYKPIVFTEILRKWSAKFNYHPNEIIQLFSDMGYKCYFVSDKKLKELVKMTEKTTETNFFFLHRDKHANLLSELISIV